MKEQSKTDEFAAQLKRVQEDLSNRDLEVERLKKDARRKSLFQLVSTAGLVVGTVFAVWWGYREVRAAAVEDGKQAVAKATATTESIVAEARKTLEADTARTVSKARDDLKDLVRGVQSDIRAVAESQDASKLMLNDLGKQVDAIRKDSKSRAEGNVNAALREHERLVNTRIDGLKSQLQTDRKTVLAAGIEQAKRLLGDQRKDIDELIRSERRFFQGELREFRDEMRKGVALEAAADVAVKKKANLEVEARLRADDFSFFLKPGETRLWPDQTESTQIPQTGEWVDVAKWGHPSWSGGFKKVRVSYLRLQQSGVFDSLDKFLGIAMALNGSNDRGALRKNMTREDAERLWTDFVRLAPTWRAQNKFEP